MEWTAPTMQRRDALAQYLTELGLEYGAGPRSVPETLTFGSLSLPLDPWERGILQHSLNNVADRAKPWAPLLAEGLALQFKCLTLDDPAGAGSAPDEDALERMIVDAAVGLALMAEAQRCIDQLVVAGEMAEAKKLTAFRHRIVQCVARIKERIGEAGAARAENKAEGMVAPAHARVATGSAGPDPATAAQRPPRNAFGGKRSAAQVVVEAVAKPRKLLGPLSVVLGVALLVWLVFFMPRLLHHLPPVLEQRDFAAIAGVTSIHARPPSLYIKVDEAAWNALGKSGRKSLLAEIGAVAEKAGYAGAQVSAEASGRPVARWLKTGGATLLGE